MTGPPPREGLRTGEAGIRRRPVPVNSEWTVAKPEDGETEDEVVFEDELPSPFQDYVGIFCDYIFWVLLAYCACNVFLWVGEKAGVISPRFEEWNPVRWWHSNPGSLQKELFEKATVSSSTETQFDMLKSWIEAPGGWVNPKLFVSDYLSEKGRYDRRLEVRQAVEKDEVLVKLPLSHVLSAAFCQQDITDTTIRQLIHAQNQSSEGIEVSPWAWITLYMVAHSMGGSKSSSSWRFDSLLRNEYIDAVLSYIPLFWNDDELAWLEGSDFLNNHLLDVHAAIETEYHKLVYLVPAVENTITVIEFKKWAMMVMSRGETVDLPDPENRTRTSPQLAVMPLIDLVDHHLPMPKKPFLNEDDLREYQQNGSHTNISYNKYMDAVVLKVREAIPAASGVTAGYGVRPNADYLIYHGFTMPREWSDLTLCTQHTMIDLPIPELPAWKSRFLVQPYRFSVPVCPGKVTPHVAVGAARFMVVSEDDVLAFDEKLAKDSTLLENYKPPKADEFLHHGVRQSLSAVCDVVAQPPLCRAPLSVASELAAWQFIKQQTLVRVGKHTTSTAEDDKILSADDVDSTLTVNQRHAVIVRREEKLAVRRWCGIVMRVETLLLGENAEAECEVVRIPDEENLENDEPRIRPKYWASLAGALRDADIPVECNPR